MKIFKHKVTATKLPDCVDLGGHYFDHYKFNFAIGFGTGKLPTDPSLVELSESDYVNELQGVGIPIEKINAVLEDKKKQVGEFTYPSIKGTLFGSDITSLSQVVCVTNREINLAWQAAILIDNNFIQISDSSKMFSDFVATRNGLCDTAQQFASNNGLLK